MARFVYCLNTSTIRPQPLLEKIRVAAAAGYDGVELWFDEIDAYLQDGGTLADLRARLEDAGLKVPSLVALRQWWDTQGDAYTAAMRANRRKLDLAAALGAAHVVAGGAPAHRADRRLGAQRYGELLALGHEVGVRPALEFLGFVDEFNTLEAAIDVMRAAPVEGGCLTIDPFHLFRGGSGFAAFAQADLRVEEIGVLHFNDTPAHPPRLEQHDPCRVLPGDGHLPLKDFLDTATRLGYRGALSLELFNRDLWQADPSEVARRGLERMKQLAGEP